MTVLDVDNLSVFYGDVRAAEDVSIRVEQGEIVCLIGANGAGKTSVLKAIMGLVRPRRGTITFAGQDITALPSWERAKLGISLVPEGRGIFPDLTVRDNLQVSLFCRVSREKWKEDLEAVFGLFPVLREREGQKAKTLSGGEQQMLAIARSMMCRPRLLLVDEASLGLMPRMVNSIYDALVRLPSEGISVLIVEQNARKALGLANRGYVMQTGAIVLAGPSNRLKEDPMVKELYLGN